MESLKAVIFDLDGTLTPVRSIWQYIHEELGTWESHGRRSLQAFLAGEIDYEEFARRDAAAWAGVSRRRIEELVERIPLRPGTQETVATLRRSGCRLAILSSGLDILAERVREICGFDLALANRLVFRNDVLTGEVEVRVGWYGKPEGLQYICRCLGTHPGETAVVGDGVGDAPLFSLVRLGVAFNAPPEVAAAAHLAVEGDDLRVILEAFQTYGRRERVVG
ncbi:MAG: Phosphoserine phosphatase-like hydrolase [Clostridia bacterium 62_21]|nr:MAG: Phosphoserine phosphatase-like hydrolase [Clostridia bacterium 62_21]